MLLSRNQTRKRVRNAVKTTRRAMNRALDRAEPRLEDAAESFEDLRRDTVQMLHRQSEEGMQKLREGYGKLQSRLARNGSAPRRLFEHPGRVALIAVGVVTLAIGVMR